MFEVDTPRLLALAWLAFIGSFTPGPNNAIAATTGVRFGWRAARAQALGVPLGFSLMLTAGAAGAGAAIAAQPALARLLTIGGAAWIVWLGVGVVRSARRAGPAPPERHPPVGGEPSVPGGEAGRADQAASEGAPGVVASAIFQLANPKAWVLAAATASAATTLARPAWLGVALVCGVFGVFAGASILTWAAAGTLLESRLRSAAARRRVDEALGWSLVAAGLWLAA